MANSTCGQLADTPHMSSDTATTMSLDRELNFHSPTAPPFGLEEARKRSRAKYPLIQCPRLTFSTTVKHAFDLPGSDNIGATKDHHLEDFLCVMPSQRLGATGNIPDFDALHFDFPSTSEAPGGYDEIHLRNVFNHDIAFAVVKQNRAEAAIKASGFLIDYAISDAHLLIIFGHLMKSPHSGTESAESKPLVTYDVYHDHRNRSDIKTQYWHAPSQTWPHLNTVIPEHALPDHEAVHHVYQKPYFVRHVGDLVVIKAWEMLTKETTMQWLAHRPGSHTPYWLKAFFFDKVTASGELSFDVELVHQELPVGSVPVSCSDCSNEVGQDSGVEVEAGVIRHEWKREEDQVAWLTVNDSVIGSNELQV